ncbi:peptidase M14, partial [Idiomarina piscisalsi]
MLRKCIRYVSALTVAIVAVPSIAVAENLSYYLPADVSYDESITKPKEALGYNVGDWHARPEQIVNYMKQLAEESDRITFEETGRTHEQRPLVLLT